MGVEVSSRVKGGQRYTAECTEWYRSVAGSLTQASKDFATASSFWSTAVLDLGYRQSKTWACPLETGADLGPTPGAHLSPPYPSIQHNCREHGEVCSAISKELSQLADLLTRANLLYQHADEDARRSTTMLHSLAGLLSPATIPAFLAQAMGGAATSSMKSRRFNPIGALEATKHQQESLLRSIAVPLNIMAGKPAFDSYGVARAAGTLAMAESTLNDLWQGNKLDVKPVESQAEVVRPSHNTAEAMENLRRLAEERQGDLNLGSGLSYGTIAIQQYVRPDGSISWLVTIPGTDGKPDSPFGWPQNLELMSNDPRQRMLADSARMVDEAMHAAGIKPGDPVALIGHSQGGIVAATIASDMQDSYNIQHVVTCGSPIANHPIPSHTWVTSVEMDSELVAAADGNPNPTGDNWLTVTGSVTQTNTAPTPAHRPQASAPQLSTPAKTDKHPSFASSPVQNPPKDPEITHWLKYHQAAYQNASDLGSKPVHAHDEHFSQVIAGEPGKITYWQGRMSHEQQVSAGGR
ncbi:hypothetical protein CRD60_00685 [Bifidobacterium aemilianum]|uniref:GPI inositol-deacylase PGAP1-like alpha/beta domain-containing protein n=1 Tax=Bifidobacterium aemilianum TaxID=2493120 RepID=A0A366KB68_9BIFI|nr:alpha/beta hydrolase [Bifidobacterium aemilianum]RBP98418.1 hypothetical protein CRD60_00685 [Bifidobacterium aemilianum]